MNKFEQGIQKSRANILVLDTSQQEKTFTHFYILMELKSDLQTLAEV